MADVDASEDGVFGRSMAARDHVIAAQVEESRALRNLLDETAAADPRYLEEVRYVEDLTRQVDTAMAEIEAMTRGALSLEAPDAEGRAIGRLAAGMVAEFDRCPYGHL